MLAYNTHVYFSPNRMDSIATLTTGFNEPVTRSWRLMSSGDGDTERIQESVDHLLDGYSFYPEVDWARFGYRPPDGYQVLGAWRHPQASAFVFLLDNPKMLSQRSAKQFIVYAAGIENEIQRFEEPIRSVKKVLRKTALQLRNEAGIQKSLASTHKARSAQKLLGLLSLFTAAVNALSLYLRRVPAPPLGLPKAAEAYTFLLMSVHLSALVLLLCFVVICLVYTVKYGILIVRQL